MKAFYGILIIFILISMIDLSQQVFINATCTVSSQCRPKCIEAIGQAASKCINRKCKCYP
uniref:Putative potassium channel toxin Ts22 n=2 Tax=Tityus TaxID=6886 RepID=KTX22_TITSE|nr:RecName: Full=Putative potassium channel toxin Ts22; AltName: Full=Putative KTx; AltName: Full=Tityustoxin-22; Flags: Precursor [Tityus serrulatus]WLF82711.1 putative KTx [Tityus melici]